MKNKGLGNPAVISSVLASEQGQKAIGKTQDVFFTVLKVGLVATVLVVAYYKIFKGFTKLKEESNYYPSNISITNAKARAEALYTAMLGFGANYDAVESSLKGLNHNGFIRVYNEFG